MILARLLTETLVLTRYAVPASVICTVALSVFVMVLEETKAAGAVVSIVTLLLEALDRLPASSTA